jgi:ActR/RegA family two-component response regulator
MHRSAAVLCHDTPSLQTLKTALKEFGIDQVTCRTHHQAMEVALDGRCSVLIVDFDLPGAGEVTKMASSLAPLQRPMVLALAAMYPGTGTAFQSGANRILYKPLEMAELKDAVSPRGKLMKKNRRTAPRHEMKTMVYLECEGRTLPAVAINVCEQGFAIQATEHVPLRSNLHFHCVLPGTSFTLRGHADIVWADNRGRAGAFFSRLAPSERKHLKHWLSKQSSRRKGGVRVLLPPANAEMGLAFSV